MGASVKAGFGVTALRRASKSVSQLAISQVENGQLENPPILEDTLRLHCEVTNLDLPRTDTGHDSQASLTVRGLTTSCFGALGQSKLSQRYYY